MSDSFLSNLVSNFMDTANKKVAQVEQGIKNNSYVQATDQKLQQLQQIPAVQRANQATEQIMNQGHQAMEDASKKAAQKILETVLTQDQQKAMYDRQIEQVQQQIAANNQQLVRQPIQMQREFGSEQEKQEYLQRNNPEYYQQQYPTSIEFDQNNQIVSDKNAKTKIHHANKDMNLFLNNIYQTMKRKT